MEISVSYQLLQAASSLALGAAAGFLYDIFRVVRRRARSIVVTTVTDVLFWLITGAGLFLLGLTMGQGRQRLFMVILAFLSAAAYFAVLSPLSLIVCNALADGFLFLLWCLARPFVWGHRLVKKILTFIKNIFLYFRKCYTIKRETISSAKRQIRTKRRTAAEKEAVQEDEKGGYSYENRNTRSDRLRDLRSPGHARQNTGRRGLQAGAGRTGGGKKNRHGGSSVQDRP